jgi:AraC-like DNA-binding protein
MHAPLARPGRYERLLGVPVTFCAGRNALCLDAASLELPLSQANPDLFRHLQRRARDELDALGWQSITARVCGLLAVHPHWARERIAGEMNMSVRHLVRRLGAEGACFKRVRDDLRQRFAERALRDNARIGDVAEWLGFADANAFARAFRRWVGVTPARFRDASRAPGGNDVIDR